MTGRVQLNVLSSWQKTLITLDTRTGVLKLSDRKVQVRGADVNHSRRGTSIVTHGGEQRRPQILTIVPVCRGSAWRSFSNALTLAALSPPGYRVLRRLGNGGSGRVYAAAVDAREQSNVGNRTHVAVKLVPRSHADDCAAEVQMSQVGPKNSLVVCPLRVFYTRHHLVLVMELLEGGSLLELVAKEAVPLSRIQIIARQLLKAIESLHAMGVAHRDIKLENVMLDAAGSVRLCDLGLAAMVPRKGFCGAVGTVYTQAPEVGVDRYGLPADMWSVGVVLLVLLLRAVPFSPTNRDAIFAKMRRFSAQGDDPLAAIMGKKRRTALPASLLDLLRGLLDFDPEHRLGVKQALEQAFLTETLQTDKVLPDARPVSIGALCDVKVRLRRLVAQMRDGIERGEEESKKEEEEVIDSEEDDAPELKMLSIAALIDIKMRLRRVVQNMRERRREELAQALAVRQSQHNGRPQTRRGGKWVNMLMRSPLSRLAGTCRQTKRARSAPTLSCT